MTTSESNKDRTELNVRAADASEETDYLAVTWPHVTLLSWFCAACSLFTGIACGRAGGCD